MTPYLLCLGLLLSFEAYSVEEEGGGSEAGHSRGGEDSRKSVRECLRRGRSGDSAGCFGQFRRHGRHERGRHRSNVGARGGFRAQNHSGGSSGQGRAGAKSRGGYQPMSVAAAAVTAVTNINRNGEPAQIAPAAAARPTALPDARDPDEAREIAAAMGRAGFDSIAELQAALNQDIADCSGASSSASQCCGDPMSCRGQLDGGDGQSLDAASALLASGPAAGGLKAYCAQMKSLSGNSRNLNSGLASVCFEAQDSCAGMCEDLVEEYTGLLSQCSGCEAQTVYQAALSRLQAGERTCSALGNKATQLADNGFGAKIDQALATQCTDVASAQPSSQAGATPTSGAPSLKIPSGQALDENGDNKTASSNLSADGKPFTELQVDASTGFKGYSNSQGPQTQRNKAGDGRSDSSSKSAAPPTQAAAAGAKAAPAGAGAKPQDKNPADKSKNDPAAPVAAADKSRAVASEPAMPITGSDSQFKTGTDLSQYLPRGVRSAMNRLVRSKEINEKEEDLFWRITLKMKEKCRMGILLECE